MIISITPPLCGFLFDSPLTDDESHHLYFPHSQQSLGQLIGRWMGRVACLASTCHRIVAFINHYFSHGEENPNE